VKSRAEHLSLSFGSSFVVYILLDYGPESVIHQTLLLQVSDVSICHEEHLSRIPLETHTDCVRGEDPRVTSSSLAVMDGLSFGIP
jgi:hypothetical protein